MESEDVVALLVDNNTTTYETMLLAHMVHDSAFYYQVKDTLCTTTADGRTHNDFSTPRYTALFIAIRMHYELAGHVGPPAPAAVEGFLTTLARAGKLIDEAAVPLAITTDLMRVCEMDLQHTAGIVTGGLRRWFTKRRQKGLVAESMHTSPLWSPDMFSDDIMAISRDAARLEDTEEKEFVGFGEEEMPESNIHRVPLSRGALGMLSLSIGGGLGMGEAVMFISPTGGGKTVLACQIAADLVITGGVQGMIVTTEQHPDELRPRILSNLCQIPFAKLKDGLGMAQDQLTEEEKKEIASVSKRIDNDLTLVNWTTRKSRKTITAGDLEESIDRLESERGVKISFVILDWIGGALVEDGDYQNIRHRYDEAATAMSDLASSRRIITVTMAQAAYGTPPTKKRIDRADLAEAKSMTKNMAVVVGLSAIPAPQLEGASGDQFLDEQWLCVSKCRRGGARFFKVIRDYGYQNLAAYRG